MKQVDAADEVIRRIRYRKSEGTLERLERRALCVAKHTPRDCLERQVASLLVERATHRIKAELWRTTHGAAAAKSDAEKSKAARLETQLYLEILDKKLSVLRAERNAHRKSGAKGGKAKQEKNAKALKQSQAKQLVHDFYLERDAGRHPKLRTQEQFAVAALARTNGDLESIGTIVKWCAEWNKEIKKSRAKL